MDNRKTRGLQIAKAGGIQQTKYGWIVPAQGGTGVYHVKKKGDNYTCDCPDCQTRGVTCKHSYAVMYTISKTVDQYGNTTITETKRITYKQDWKNYNKAQIFEIELFDILLKDLVQIIEEPKRTIGKPKQNRKDAIF